MSKSARAFDRVAVATRPRDLGAARFFRLTVAFPAFVRLTDCRATFLVLAAFFAAGFFLATSFFRLAGFLLVAFLAVDFLATDFRPAAFFAAGLPRLALLRADFFADTFFLVTLDFFPEGFFLDDVFRFAALLREEAALVRFLLAGFLAAIFYSHRSEKNAELYIDCGHMEAQKQGFFDDFLLPGACD